jgi:hypothetical protein
MLTYGILFIVLFVAIVGGLVVGKLFEQSALDHQRRTYELSFPADLDPEAVTEFFRQVSGVLRPRTSAIADLFGLSKAEQMVRGTPSIVLETWGTSDGIHWLLKVPFGYEPLVRGRLEALISGVQVQDVEQPPTRVWAHGVELSLRAGHRPMNIHNAILTSVSVRSPFGHVAPEESLVLQWVITPMTPEHKPAQSGATSKETTLRALLTGTTASRDEISDRRDKLAEPNLLTVVRVAAVAASASRASVMVRNVTAAFDSARGASNYFTVHRMPLSRLQERVETGGTPLIPPVQVSAPELASFVGWPLGDVQVPGQPAPLSRRIPAPGSVPSDGIRLGVSNYSGRERPVALGYKEALVHQHVLAPPGKGKTVLLTNEFRQIVDAGYGAVVIEQKGDLFYETLNQIPESRISDVIVFDVNDTKYPVGFNVLKDGPPALAVDAIDSIFRSLYKDHPSLWANKAMYHGLMTLAEKKDGTVIDLMALLSPTSEEAAWSDALRSNVRSPELRRYWQDVQKDGKHKEQSMMEPIHNRFWPIMRSNLVNILGQTSSSFTMEEVVQQNKILLVNLSGIDKQAAELMGAIIVSAMWKAAKAYPMPDSPNFLIMDEAHHFMKLPIDLGLMLVEARRFGVGMVFAHQGLYQLPTDMRQAVQQNMQTKVVFQTLADDARDMARILGTPITDYDISHLPQYGAIARVATPTGISTPFTLATQPAVKGYDNAQRIIYASRGRYGREVNQVQDEILARRVVAEGTKRRRARRGPSPEDLGGAIA